MRYKPRVSLAQISKKALCLHNSDFVPLTRIAQIWSWKSPLFTYEIPYENAKEMLLVEEIDNKDFLTGLFNVMYDELPTQKPKKKK